jgi:hypothetical protein
MSTTEILKAFFFDGTDVPAGGDVRIDVLDSWTNTGNAVLASSVTHCDGWFAASS